MDGCVRDHIPLEQGLRHTATDADLRPRFTVRDHIPLEQGLRHKVRLVMNICLESQRPYSIRTRIKTYQRCYLHYQSHPVRDHIPLEQGLRQRSD